MGLGDVDEQAFLKLIRENLRRIRWIAGKFHSGADADDVSQEILLQLWRSFPTFRGDSAAATWVYRIAVNTAVTYERKHYRHRQQIPLDSTEELQGSDPDSLRQAEILKQFLGQLKEMDAVLLMMYLDGLSAEDMANVVGMSGNNVSARISRMKKRFEAQYVGEPA